MTALFRLWIGALLLCTQSLMGNPSVAQADANSYLNCLAKSYSIFPSDPAQAVAIGTEFYLAVQSGQVIAPQEGLNIMNKYNLSEDLASKLGLCAMHSPPIDAPAQRSEAPRSLPGDSAFIDDAKKIGVRSLDGNDKAIVFVGYQICGEMYRGVLPAAIAEEIIHNNPQANPAFTWVNNLNPVSLQQAQDLIRSAYNDVCPTAVAVYPSSRVGKSPWQP
mgnify:CR=1 FL=1